MAEIVNLFGPQGEQEEAVKEATPAEVFEKCNEYGFSKVLVIGTEEDGTLGFSTNLQNPAQVTYLVEKFKFALMQE
jgi:hypothetical protein